MGTPRKHIQEGPIAEFCLVIETSPVDEWQKRSASLRKLVDRIPEGYNQDQDGSYWYNTPTVLRHLAIPVSELIKDARSTVVKRTCESLTRLFVKCRGNARYLFRDLMATVLSVHAQTVQVIRAAVQSMIMESIPSVPCKMVMPLWMERLKVDKSRTVREACALYLGHSLDMWTEPGYFTQEIWMQVGSTFIRTLRDPSPQVRTYAKEALERMQSGHPDVWDKLVNDPSGPASKDPKAQKWLKELGRTGYANIDADELSIASRFSYNSDTRFAARSATPRKTPTKMRLKGNSDNLSSAVSLSSIERSIERAEQQQAAAFRRSSPHNASAGVPSSIQISNSIIQPASAAAPATTPARPNLKITVPPAPDSDDGRVKRGGTGTSYNSHVGQFASGPPMRLMSSSPKKQQRQSPSPSVRSPMKNLPSTSPNKSTTKQPLSPKQSTPSPTKHQIPSQSVMTSSPTMKTASSPATQYSLTRSRDSTDAAESQDDDDDLELQSNPSFPADLTLSFRKEHQEEKKELEDLHGSAGTTPRTASPVKFSTAFSESNDDDDEDDAIKSLSSDSDDDDDDDDVEINEQSMSLEAVKPENMNSVKFDEGKQDGGQVATADPASSVEESPFIASMQELKKHASRRRSRNSMLMQERFRMSMSNSFVDEDNGDQPLEANKSEEENEVPNDGTAAENQSMSKDPLAGAMPSAPAKVLAASAAAPEHMIIAIRLLRAHKAHVDHIMETLKIEMDTLRDFDRLLEEPGRPTEDEVLDYFEGVGLCLDQRTQAGAGLQREMDRISRGEPSQE